MKKKTKIFIIIGIIIAVILASVILLNKDEGTLTYVSYKEFHSELENGNISEVLIEDDSVKFIKNDDNNEYYTENPEYDTFKEDILLSGAKLKINSAEENINFVFDMLFYLFFFTMIIVIIIIVLGINRKNFKVIKHTNVKFDDIAGMDDLKKEMMVMVDVLKNPKTYIEKGIRPTKGIILEGNPGNGKTLFAKALAEEANVNFIATKGADFQSAMMSMGSKKIKSLFKKARKHKPCIIFIDEFDGIGERRNYAGTGVDKENNRIITAMLNEMDGFVILDGILVIAATNSYSSLDSALIRPGRFDLKYNIPNPDLDTRIKLIEIYTKNKMLEDEISKEKLAESFENLSCSAIETILNEASMIAVLENRDKIKLDDIILASKKTNCNINLRRLRR